MPFFPKGLFTIGLAAIVFTGAFSLFTHGAYTPRFYQYQEYHQEDDGTLAAQIVPTMDAILGSMLLWRKTRKVSAIIITCFFVFGLLIQLKAGKHYMIDLFTILVGALAVLDA